MATTIVARLSVLQTAIGQIKTLLGIPGAVLTEENVRVSINICHEPLITVEVK